MRASRSATSWVWSVPVNALEKVGCRGEVSEDGVGGYTPRKGEVLVTENANPSGGPASRTRKVQIIQPASAGWLGAPAAPKSREGDARRWGER